MSKRQSDFIYRSEAEPHAARKVEILKKHPEIKDLMVYEPRTKYLVAATVILQVFKISFVRISKDGCC